MKELKDFRRLNFGVLNSVVFASIVFVLVIAVLLVFGCEDSSAGGTGNFPAPENGDWIVNNATKVWNETIILNGNLTIEENGSLIFNNVTIKMNCSEDGEFGILVNENGEFYIYDYDNNTKTKNDRSNITANNPNYEFRFLVDSGAKFEVKNSEICECGYPGRTSEEHGLTIKTDNSVIENSSFYNNYISIYFYSSNNNTVYNCTIFHDSNHFMNKGIMLADSSYNKISKCNISNKKCYGIWLQSSSNNTISKCNIKAKYDYSSIYISESNNNKIWNNSITGSGIKINGNTLSQFIHTIENNSINNKPIYYYKNKNNFLLNETETGQIIFANCSNFKIENVTITDVYVGINIVFCKNNSISNCNLLNNIDIAIWLKESLNTNISNCNFSKNDDYGIFLDYSNNITISNCNISNNDGGIRLLFSNNNIITSCNISKSDKYSDGICLHNSSNNNISFCNISNGYDCIEFSSSSNNNTISYCNLSNGYYYGIELSAYNNTINDCNVFNNNRHGIDLSGSDNTITNCYINNNEIYGFYLSGSFNNILSCNISNNKDDGIKSWKSDNNAISNCNISNNGWGNGIEFELSNNNTISMNNISNHYDDGILLLNSNYNKIIECFISNYYIQNSIRIEDASENNISNNNFIKDGIIIYGKTLSHFIHTIDNNTIDNKPLLYYKHKNNITLSELNIGQIIIVNCSNFIIKNINNSNKNVGIEIGYGKNNTISHSKYLNNRVSILFMYTINNNIINCNISSTSGSIKLIKSCNNNISECNISIDGIWLDESSNNNTISYCNFFHISGYNIRIKESRYNTIINCNILNTNDIIWLYHAKNNIISHCNIINNEDGIKLYYSSNNTISYCNISDNYYGIMFKESHYNIISYCNISTSVYGIIYEKSNNNTIYKCNILKNNYYGSYFWDSSNNNTVYSNSYIDNDHHALDICSNIWDNNTVGNYWDDYEGKDSDKDYIGDTPYDIIGGNSKDRYPLMFPWDQDDKTPPEINDVSNYPVIEEKFGNINITGNITDNEEVNAVKVNITYPDNSTLNQTMSKGSYYFNTTYSMLGKYDYFIWANDTSNNSNISKTYSFNITDTTPPKISNITISNITNNSAIITWNTNENSTSLLKYGLNESYGYEKSNNTFKIKHLIKLTELDSNTTYHFTVNSTDESNNTNQSKDYLFTTKKGEEPDNLPPKIKNVTCFPDQQEKGGFVNISCNVTDNEEVNIVKVNITYPDESTINVTMSKGSYFYNTTYSIVGKYDYFIWADDTSSNNNTSTNYSFIIQDTTSPQIYNITNSTPTQNSVTITWETDEPSTSLVKYGLNKTYSNNESNETLVTFHNLTLTDIKSNTTYHFCVNSTDESGNTNQSADYNFTTESKDWTVTENETIENETITINGTLTIGNNGELKLINSTLYTKSIIVREGGTFFADPTEIYMDGDLYIDGTYILDNTILKMNCTYDGEYKIRVNNTGTMKIINGSKITSNNSEYEFKFLVNPNAVFEMRNSTLNECGYTEFGENDGRHGLTIKANNTIIENSSFFDNFYSIYLYRANNNTIINNNISNNYYGNYLYISDNNTIINNNISNNYYGNYLTFSNNNNLINNIATKNNATFHLNFSNNNKIINNNVSKDNWGIYLDSSSINTITNNNVSENSWGVYLRYSNNNNLTNNHISNNYYGIKVWISNNNRFLNSSLTDNIKGLYFSFSGNNTITNSSFINSTNYDFYLTSNSKISAINSTFNNSKITIDDTFSELIVKWYLNILVEDNNKKPIPNASVRVEDNYNGTFDKNYTTDLNGTIKWIEITEYNQNSTNTTQFTPYMITTSKDIISNQTYLIINETKTTNIKLLIFNENWTVNKTISFTNETIILKGNLIIEDGGNLTFNNVTLIMNCSFDGEYYIEIQDRGEFYINDYNSTTINDSSNITAYNTSNRFMVYVRNNGVLEMNNSELHYCGYNETYPGLTIESDNVTIKNTLFSNNTNAIFINSSSPKILNATIINNTVGIAFYNSSAQIINCTIQNSTGFDFWLDNNSNPFLINCTFEKENEFNFGDNESSLEVNWYTHIIVTDQKDNPIPNADVRIQDNDNGIFDENYTTDQNGTIKWIVITEYKQNNTNTTNFTPYLIITSKDIITKQTSYVINETRTITIKLMIFNENWTVNKTESYINQTIILNANLTIENVGNLTFKNVTLLVNSTEDEAFYIEVQNGGEFNIYDYDNNFTTLEDTSNISGNDNKFLFYIREGAAFDMKYSELHGCGIDEEKPGFEINSDNILLEGNLFSNNNYGIYSVNSSLEIYNTTFKDNVNSVYVRNSTLILVNCTIENSVGFDFFLTNQSDLIVINSTFDKENVQIIDNGSNLTVLWYLQINLTDFEENPIPNATVTVKDNMSETPDEYYTTDENGTVKWIICVEYIQNNITKENFTPYNIIAVKNDKSSEESLEIHESQPLDIKIQLLDVIKPKILNPNATEITQNSVTITWSTDEASNSSVKYSDDKDKNMSEWDVEESSSYVTVHSIKITNLNEGTTYYYYVNSTDASGNTNQSERLEFETSGPLEPELEVEIEFFDNYFLSDIPNYKINVTVSNDTSSLWGVDLEFGTIIDGNIEKIDDDKTDTNGNYIIDYKAPMVNNDTQIFFWVNAIMDGYKETNQTSDAIWIRVINVSKPNIEGVIPDGIQVTVLAGIIGNGEITVNSTINPDPFITYKDIGVFLDINFAGNDEDFYWINITVNYQDGSIPENIEEQDLEFYFWNETANNGTGEWEYAKGSKVDVDNNFVWVNLSHLTIFAPRDEDAEPPIEEKYPDLTVENIALSNTNPKIGEEITITATINNVGESIATNFIVKFYVDDVEIESQTITTLDIGLTEEISVTWKATEGNHTIRVTIENVVNEENTNNNEAIETITVEKAVKKDDGGGFPIIMIGIPIVVVVVFVALLKLNVIGGIMNKEEEDERKGGKKKKKKKGKGGKKKKKGEVEEEVKVVEVKEEDEEKGEEVKLHEKGVELFKIGKYEDAIRNFNLAIEFDPGYEKAWYNKGLIYKKIGKDDEAIESFSKAIDVYHEYVKAWYQKGRILQKMYRYEDAIECYEKALELDPDFEKAENAIEICNEKQEMEEQLPEDEKGKINHAKGLEVALDYDGAISIYKDLDMEEDIRRVKIEKAKSHESYHELEIALKIFEEIDSIKDIKRVKKKIAMNLETYNRFEEALKIYEVIESIEDIKRIKTMQAVELESIDEFDAALDLYREIDAIKEIKRIRTMQAVEMELMEEFDAAIMIYEEIDSFEDIKRIKTMLADEFEEMEEFENAAQLYAELEMWDEARRVRLNARKPLKDRVKPKWKKIEEPPEPEAEVKEEKQISDEKEVVETLPKPEEKIPDETPIEVKEVLEAKIVEEKTEEEIPKTIPKEKREIFEAPIVTEKTEVEIPKVAPIERKEIQTEEKIMEEPSTGEEEISEEEFEIEGFEFEEEKESVEMSPKERKKAEKEAKKREKLEKGKLKKKKKEKIKKVKKGKKVKVPKIKEDIPKTFEEEKIPIKEDKFVESAEKVEAIPIEEDKFGEDSKIKVKKKLREIPEDDIDM